MLLLGSLLHWTWAGGRGGRGWQDRCWLKPSVVARLPVWPSKLRISEAPTS